ncbi:hypothetical protein QJQ45_019267 [Haematococcus lacustris]|nr:hypothetical protein QJQ45_019267 [Haematococcus lacustris]
MLPGVLFVALGIQTGKLAAPPRCLPPTPSGGHLWSRYTVKYDYRTRNAQWVLEHLTQESCNGSGGSGGGADRHVPTPPHKGDCHDVMIIWINEHTGERWWAKSEFFQDPAADPLLCSKLADFRGSGYDRGHLAPAADHRNSQEAMDQTFSLLNISPQVGEGFNRDYWCRLERHIRSLTSLCADVFVVTGPLFMPTLDATGQWVMKHPLIGAPPSLVAVPTHFYKVVVATGAPSSSPLQSDAASGGSGSSSSSSSAVSSPLRSEKDMAVAAFVLPNAPIDPHTPLSAFVVPLEPLEAVAGTRFFPELLTEARRQVLSEAAQEWRQYGLQRMGTLDRQTLIQGPQAPLALPAPAEAVTACSTGSSGRKAGAVVRSSKKQGASTDLSLPRTRSAAHALHLCEVTACQLPPPQTWNQDKAAKAKKGSGAALIRSKSWF